MTGLIVDNFAGGGGASTALEIAFGRKVDIAINHDENALAMHAANHPDTLHLKTDVFDVDPSEVCAGQPIDAAWFSPDCTHFSRAAGGKPRSNKRRSLAWVVLRWASLPKWQRPRVIFLENVEEFLSWGPLTKSGKPCKQRAGQTFELWKSHLRALGYQVETNLLRASDFGAATIRKRLFLVARCDGDAVVWPKPTHGNPTDRKSKKLKTWKTAADVIDWSIECPSIFNRQRPLSENTLRRIAIGIEKYVLSDPKPFIVRVTQSSSRAPMAFDKPVNTITTAKGGEFALVSAFLAQHNGGPRPGRQARRSKEPVSTITTTGSQQSVIACHLLNLKGSKRQSYSAETPVPTICAGAGHVAEVRAFLVKYYGSGTGASIKEPLHTVTTKDRFGLITLKGQDYQIADIGMRMLTPRELFNAQGFPSDYIIDVECAGRKLSKADQIRKVGNSVSPPPAIALAVANAPVLSRLMRMTKNGRH